MTPAPRNTTLTRHLLRCHATRRNLGRSPAALAAKLPRAAGCCSLVGDCFRSADLGKDWVPREMRHTFVSVYRHEIRPALTQGAEVMDKIFG